MYNKENIVKVICIKRTPLTIGLDENSSVDYEMGSMLAGSTYISDIRNICIVWLWKNQV